MHLLATMNGFRRAARSLRQSPGFALSALLVLALGIGLTTAIFSVVDPVILRPLAFPHAERLIRVGERLDTFGDASTAYANFLDWSRQAKTLSASFAWRPDSITMSDGRSAERVSALRASAGFFETVGIRPSLGHAFRAEDDRRGAPGRAVITDAEWNSRFGRDPNIVGHSIVLAGEPFAIVGVMPAAFRFPLVKVEVIVPYGRTAGMNRGDHQGEAFARLKPGVTVEQANAELATIGRALSAAYPDSNSGWGLSATSLETFVTKDSRAVMLTVLAAVGLVLLLACVNVAGLMLVRATGRRREFAVRIALGARLSSILRESINEALLIALGGGALGVLAASWSIGPLLSLVPETTPIPAISIDWRVLLFAAAVTAVAAVLFAIVPAMRSIKTDPNDALKEGGRANTGMHGNRSRSVLVVAEIALAAMLALSAGLVIKSFGRLIRVDPGFDADHVLTFNAEIGGPAYAKGSAKIAFWRRLLDEASAKRSIARIGMASFLPMTENDTENGYLVEGRPQPKNNGELPYADLFVIGGDYFGTMGIQLLRGRAFAPTDNATAPPVVIIDEEFARKNFPHDDPLQHRINYNDRRCQIIGVVRHVKDFGLNGTSREQFYFPFEQTPWTFMTITVRPAADTASAIEAVRDTVRGVDAGVPVFEVRPMASWVSDSTWRQRLGMVLLAVFSGVALVLASIGVYGVMAYSVAQQTQEIGIRLALGATRALVLRMVLRRALLLTIAGVTIGGATALPLAGLLGSLLFDVPPSDPAVFAAVASLLLLVGLLAGVVPALRAANTDPLLAIRSQ
ncbi:MAG: ABC transporter permease [Bryobacteraceae bacterium]